MIHQEAATKFHDGRVILVSDQQSHLFPARPAPTVGLVAELVPTVEFAEWKDPGRRARLVETLDACLRDPGMFLLLGHGVPPELPGQVRSLGSRFFGLSMPQKSRYAVRGAYGNGWRGPGLVKSGAYEGVDGPPDLHEAFHVGPTHRTGDTAFDALYYPENLWPVELPELAAVLGQYTDHMTRLAHEVLTMFAEVLGALPDVFTAKATRATWTQNVNWYPSRGMVGEPVAGQMQVGSHCDFGTLSLLDREPGNGLEIWSPGRGWLAPPYVKGSLAVMVGDLMQRWTDGRWRALRHRVLAPSADASDKDSVSLVFFFEADPDAVVTPLDPPAGGGAGMEPVVAGESILEKVGVINAPRLAKG